MKTYYCVTTSVNDIGVVTAAITNVISSDKKPKNNFKSTLRLDIYNDWFEDIEDAKNFVKEARMA